MISIEIAGQRYPAEISGKKLDRDWDGRESKSILLPADAAAAAALFGDEIAWEIIRITEAGNVLLDADGNPVIGEDGEAVIQTEQVETRYDNSAFCILGDIVQHRDGSMTVNMGKPTAEELLNRKVADAVSIEELDAAYAEGVNSI